jgi:hypothetical protein
VRVLDHACGRTFLLGDRMKEIKLSKGQVAKVCDCHYHLVKDYKWQAVWKPANRRYYAKRKALKRERLLGITSSVFMHRVINNTPKGFETDHRDRDSLNNQCENLRTATRAQNQKNRNVSINNKTGHKGVTYHIRDKRYISSISINGKYKMLGSFLNIEDAKKERDRAELEYYGEFAPSDS